MEFANKNLKKAHGYHLGHISHCEDQIARSYRWSIRLQLKKCYKIEPERYRKLMRSYIIAEGKWESLEQELSCKQWDHIAFIKGKGSKVKSKKMMKDIISLQKERDIWWKRKEKIENELETHGLSTSHILGWIV